MNMNGPACCWSPIEIKIGLDQFGLWGLYFESVLIIRTVGYVELVEYYMSVKNHIDRISIVM